MRVVATVLVVVSVLVYATSGFCTCSSCVAQKACSPCGDPCAGDGTALKKLGRGLCNCITFPFEIPNQMSKVNYTDGPMAAATWGLLKGIAMTGARAVVGAYEVATFPLPVPECYRPIMTDPEFFFEDQTW